MRSMGIRHLHRVFSMLPVSPRPAWGPYRSEARSCKEVAVFGHVALVSDAWLDRDLPENDILPQPRVVNRTLWTVAMVVLEAWATQLEIGNATTHLGRYSRFEVMEASALQTQLLFICVWLLTLGEYERNARIDGHRSSTLNWCI